MVVVVSFGVEEGAKKWIEDTQCPFTVLLDPDRLVYQSMGLTRSVSKTWGTKPLTYYAEQMAAGRELAKAYKDIEDDPHQMGGDLVIDKTGKVALIYCSKTASDRPSFSMLLSAVKKLNGKEAKATKAVAGHGKEAKTTKALADHGKEAKTTKAVAGSSKKAR